jgi:hypothetical protein
MITNSKRTLFVISSILSFLVISFWLFIIKEGRIGVYLIVMSLSLLSSIYIINPKIKYRIIIDFISITCILFLAGLKVLSVLSI